MPRRGLIDADTVIEIAVFALAGVMLIAGLAAVSIAGSTTTRTGYGAGLTMILLSATMCVGAGALHQHHKHSDEIAGLNEIVARLEGEITEMRREIRGLLATLAARNDELSRRRHASN